MSKVGLIILLNKTSTAKLNSSAGVRGTTPKSTVHQALTARLLGCSEGYYPILNKRITVCTNVSYLDVSRRMKNRH